MADIDQSQVDQAQETTSNTLAAASIGGAVALLIIYALLVAVSSGDGEAGHLIRSWFGWLPWIPKDLHGAMIGRVGTGQGSSNPVWRPALEADESQAKDEKVSATQREQGSLALTRKQIKAVKAARVGLEEVRAARYRFGHVLAAEDAAWNRRRSLLQENSKRDTEESLLATPGRMVTFKSLSRSVAAESSSKQKPMSQSVVAESSVKQNDTQSEQQTTSKREGTESVLERDAKHIAKLDRIGMS